MAVGRLVLLVSTTACFAAVVNGFGYNINARKTFKPLEGTANDHSYFGYSLLLRDGENPTILVGAPRDTSRHINHRNITDPGTMYHCQISENSEDEMCVQKFLDPTDTDIHERILDVENFPNRDNYQYEKIIGNTPVRLANGRSYHHRKQSMWLGMSLDGSTNNNGTVVICAPRWVNQLHSNYYLGNGLCYSVPDTLKPTNISQTSTLIPLVESDSQGFIISHSESHNTYGTNVYFYAFGQAGISTKLSDNGAELLIGAPGVFVWRGSVIRYKVRKNIRGPDYFIKQAVPNPYYTSEIKDDSYFGYAVGFGKFVSNKDTLYVGGAPRSSDYKGDVIIFDFPAKSTSKYEILVKLEGKQIGEYFGSVIATIDIDQDGLTDLLIGAPMHAEPLTWDQGKVYVYMNQDNYQFKEQEADICGSYREGGRFGSAISAIGDINDDGFIDVAIGSPYEDYGSGAVYIYLGSKNGLNPYYTQRIVVAGMQGFGISISKGVDIDKNTCNDIAVGAYVSGKVFLFKCHPSVHITPKIEVIPTELSLNLTSFTVQICLRFTGHSSFETAIQTTLAVDTAYNRASIQNRTSGLFTLTGRGGSEVCHDVVVDIESELADFSRPMELKMTYDLKKNPMLEAKFCPECTVLRPTESKELIHVIPFVSGCANLTCQPDLVLTVDILTELPYIIGSSKSLIVNISLENVGEPAYIAQTKLILSEKLPLLKIPSRCHIDDNNQLICDFDNPIYSYTTKPLLLEFDTSLLSSRDRILDFNITAISGGEEVTPKDNSVFLQIKFKASSDVHVLGTPGSNQFIYIVKDSESYNNFSSNALITHSYDILNDGPTIVDLFEIKFYIPVTYYDKITKTEYKLIEIMEPMGYLNGQPVICKPQQGTYFEEKKEGHSFDITGNATENSFLTTDNPQEVSTSADINKSSTTKPNIDLQSLREISKKSNDLTHKSFSNSIYLNCSNVNMVTCMILECEASKLNVGSNGVHIALKMKLNVENFEIILKNKYIAVLSTFSQVQPSHNDIKWESYGFVDSFIINSEPPSVPIWIYIVAFIIGIIALAILTFIFYKLGFFRRKTKEDLQNLLKNQDHSSEDTLDTMENDNHDVNIE